MNVFLDKATRYFFISILLFLSFMSAADAAFIFQQKAQIQTMYVSRSQSVVSSLLEQGVPEAIIAKAVTNTNKNEAGADIVKKLGIDEHADIRFLAEANELSHQTIRFQFIKNSILISLLLVLVLAFLFTKERLYCRAASVVKNYAEGDFSLPLPQTGEGAVYKMFSAIGNMAAVLKSKHETELKTKLFLKETISDISHQLKTPLAALSMYNEIILSEADNEKTVASFSQKSFSAISRMEQLIAVLLKITRLDSGNIMFEKKCCTICEVVSQSVAELTTRAAHEKKQIILTGDADTKISCDINWTGEAISNIVKNALDHTGKGGRVEIKWDSTPAMTRITITDNGLGIAPEDFHHIFKRFYRSKNSFNSQGTGLGLPLAKAIVEGQGGLIAVKSQPGEGTNFTLSFPKKEHRGAQ